MATLDTTNPTPTVAAIYAAYERQASRESAQRQSSGRLGASMIGRECQRQLWYHFRWSASAKFDGRMLRSIEADHLAVDRFADHLRAIGCEVHTVDPDTGERFTFNRLDGHFVCKIDAVARGLPEAPKAWHVGKFAAHRAKSFASLTSKGLAENNPEDHAHILMGMDMSGMKRGLYMAANKDTGEIYTERVRIEDHFEAIDSLKLKAFRIITSKVPPAKTSENPDYAACKWCKFNEYCHGDKVPDATCRSCCHVTPIMDDAESKRAEGRWRCERHKKSLQPNEQRKGCHDHLLIPLTINYATVDDSGYDADGTGWISYQHRDGQRFVNSKREHDYDSRELTELPAPLVGAGIVDRVKGVFGNAEVVSVDAAEQDGES